mmetsp:Transcript_5230/g.3947  ORF Transcript_5230/g.3947 Transcript_5230/m.3947 type:complete len:88 (-) Transcript_5230:2125-2388(-)
MESSANEELKVLFAAVGLAPGRIESLLKNKKASARLKEVIETAGVKECDRNVGNLLDYLSGKLPEAIYNRTKMICTFITEGKFTKTD